MKIRLAIFLLFFSTNAFAQKSVDQVALNSLVQEIVTGTGPVTKAQYDKFLQQLGLTKAEDKAQMIDVMKQRFVLAQEYQKEVWNCAEQAWNLRKIPNCTGADNKIASLRAEMKKSDSESMLNPMTDYTSTLLRTAAEHGKIQNPNGQGEVQISLEMIKSTRSGLEQMLNRFSQVLKPNYSDK